MSKSTQNLNLAIVTKRKGQYSETFIKQHIEKLPFNIHLYYGDGYPFRHDKAGILNRGLKKVLFRLIGKITGNSILDYEKSLESSLKRNKVDVVLAEYGHYASKILPVIRRSGIPLVVHFHGHDMYATKHLKKYDNYKELNEVASKIVVVSKDMLKKAESIGMSKEKLVYNVYGPDDIFHYVKTDLSQPAFLAIGRFVAKKAPQKTIVAFSKVVERVPEARLHMVGSGELLDECKRLVEKNKISSNVTFHGVLSPEEIKGLMGKVRAFVQHSVVAENGDKEGTPLAVLESQAAGLPVVATRHAGIADVVDHEQTGFLVDENDIERMAEFMTRIATDYSLAVRLGENAKKRILSNFTLQRHLDKLTQTIKDQVAS